MPKFGILRLIYHDYKFTVILWKDKVTYFSYSTVNFNFLMNIVPSRIFFHKTSVNTKLARWSPRCVIRHLEKFVKIEIYRFLLILAEKCWREEFTNVLSWRRYRRIIISKLTGRQSQLTFMTRNWDKSVTTIFKMVDDVPLEPAWNLFDVNEFFWYNLYYRVIKIIREKCCTLFLHTHIFF